uniref:DUF4252 domain-containing protein n=1 Tax=Cecembia rubra TaxID=1485585 RepID=UPI0027150721
MKKMILLFTMLLIFSGLRAQDDAIVKFFSKYMEDDRFSRVYISPKMMQMAGGFLKSGGAETDKEAKELGELISKVRGIRILSAEKLDGHLLYKEAMGTLTKNKYEELMDVEDKGSNIKFIVPEEKGRVMEMLMINGSKYGYNLISLLVN